MICVRFNDLFTNVYMQLLIYSVRYQYVGSAYSALICDAGNVTVELSDQILPFYTVISLMYLSLFKHCYIKHITHEILGNSRRS